VCAGLLVLVAAAVLTTALLARADPAGRLTPFVIGTVVAVTGTLIGLGASMWLGIQAQFDRIRGSAAASRSQTGIGSLRVALDRGPSTWLVAAAVVAAAVAVAALLAQRRRAGR
jgi:hypothetical protein